MSSHRELGRHATLTPPRPVFAGWLITVVCLSAIALAVILVVFV